MSEKRHKTKKFGNYQNVIMRNSPTLAAMFLFLLKTVGLWFLT